MTETEKMLKGKWYDANFDKELLEVRAKCKKHCWEFNMCDPDDTDKQEKILEKIFQQKLEPGITILPNLQVDYGCYTRIGKDCFINHGVYFMDGGTITLGERVFMGPNCGMYTAIHAMDASQRAQGLEIAEPIVIEDDVWIGADVSILPGVTIGKGSVIGAKSLVNKDIPAGVVAMGNPCRVFRKITEKDQIPPEELM